MKNDKKHLVNEVVKLLNLDSSNLDHFFSKEENSQWLQSLEPHGFFNADSIKNPIVKEGGSFYDPPWNQGDFLEKIAEQIFNGKISDSSTIELFLKVIRDLLVADHKNIWAMRSIFKCLFKLPVKNITVNDVSNCFKMIESVNKNNILIEFDIHEIFFRILSSIQNCSHDRLVFKEFLKNLIKFREEGGVNFKERRLIYFQEHRFKSIEDKFLNFDEYYKGKDYLLEDAVDVISHALNEILKIEGVDERSTSWRPAIEDHYQNKHHNSAESILTAVIYKIVNFLAKKGQLHSIIEQWKKSDKITFSRIYIAFNTENPTQLNINDCAHRIISLGLKPPFRHEVYHFLNKHFESLSQEIQSSILDKIETLPHKYSDDEDERKPTFTAWEKLKWLQAIKDSKNERGNKLYDANLKIIGSEPDHPDFDSYMGGTFIGPTSPWNLNDFEQSSPNEIIQKLTEYRDDDRNFDEPSIEGLSRTFESYVAQDSMKCSSLKNKMLSLPRIYLSSFFDGYSKAWMNGKFVPVEELLNLGRQAINDKSFKDDLSNKNSKTSRAISSISRFISTGVRDDKKAFKPEFNSKCYEILKLAVPMVKTNQEYENSSDALTRAINEPRGVIFEAAILLALREARIVSQESDKDSKNTPEFKKAWSNLYQIIKEPLKSQNCEEVSLHAHLGSLYRQCLYLDKDWIYKNIDLVCPPRDDKFSLRSAFIQGYCYVNVYIKEMYFLLYERGYLLEFLRKSNQDNENKGNRINTLQERIVSLATIAYILGDESLNDGLFKEILGYEDAHEWGEIICSLARLVGKEPEKDIFDRAVTIVTFMIDKFESLEKKELFKKHFQSFERLLGIFKDPKNPNVGKIIEISSYYMSDNWSHFQTIEYLFNFKDSHTSVVGTLFYKIVSDGKSFPYHPEEKIIAICQSLKDKNESESLTRICRIYSDKLPNSELTKSICKI